MPYPFKPPLKIKNFIQLFFFKMNYILTYIWCCDETLQLILWLYSMKCKIQWPFHGAKVCKWKMTITNSLNIERSCCIYENIDMIYETFSCHQIRPIDFFLNEKSRSIVFRGACVHIRMFTVIFSIRLYIAEHWYPFEKYYDL